MTKMKPAAIIVNDAADDSEIYISVTGDGQIITITEIDSDKLHPFFFQIFKTDWVEISKFINNASGINQ